MDRTKTLIIPWEIVLSLKSREQNPLWESAVSNILEIICENKDLFSSIWKASLKRLHVYNTGQFPLDDYLGNLSELFYQIPLFVNAEAYSDKDVQDKNYFALKCLSSAMLSLIKLHVLEKGRQEKKERKAFTEKITFSEDVGENSPTQKPPFLLYVAAELLKKKRLNKPEMAGFALMYKHFERYEEFQDLIQGCLTRIWPEEEEKAQKRIKFLHEKAKERWQRNRNYEGGLNKQNHFIDRLEEQVKIVFNPEGREKAHQILERRYALREKIRQQFKYEAEDFSLGGSILPLSQKHLATLFDPEGLTSETTWGRYGNRFKKDLLQKVSEIKESCHESIN